MYVVFKLRGDCFFFDSQNAKTDEKLGRKKSQESFFVQTFVFGQSHKLYIHKKC